MNDLSSTELQDTSSEHLVVEHADMERRFLGLISVRDQARHEIDQEVGDTAVAGVLDLGDVFELVIHGFNQGSFSQ